MCGIAGLIVKQSDTLPSDLVNMLKELVHRGRDATGLALPRVWPFMSDATTFRPGSP